jgi:hypothetical protein
MNRDQLYTLWCWKQDWYDARAVVSWPNMGNVSEAQVRAARDAMFAENPRLMNLAYGRAA